MASILPAADPHVNYSPRLTPSASRRSLILADALEEAGCVDAEVLRRLRGDEYALGWQVVARLLRGDEARP